MGALPFNNLEIGFEPAVVFSHISRQTRRGIWGEARYSVYRKEHDTLVRKEFAFSLDNMRMPTVMPLFCLHDRDKETFELAHLLGVLRSDKDFSLDYDARLDELLAEKKLWVRQADGFLAAPSAPLTPSAWMLAVVDLHRQSSEEGFVDRAAGCT